MTKRQAPLAIELAPSEDANSSSQINSIFNFEFHNIRIIIDEITGEVWFHANDVCTILGYKNSRDALKQHVDPHHVAKYDGVVKTGKRVDGSIYEQIGKENYINEFGLYGLILGSKLPNAIKFKRWVFEEVLPSIRKTGSYSIDQNQVLNETKLPLKYSLKFIADEIDGADRIAKYVKLEGNQAILSTCQMIRKLYDIDIFSLTEQKGLNSESQQHDFSPTEIGGMLKPVQSARKVYQLLIDAGFQTRSQNPKLNRVVYQPTELGKSFAILKDTMKKHSDGTPILQVRWFEKIVEFLQSRVVMI